jgi:hypothetical protein
MIDMTTVMIIVNKVLDRNVSTFQDALMDCRLSENQALLLGSEVKVAHHREIQTLLVVRLCDCGLFGSQPMDGSIIRCSCGYNHSL